VGGDDRKALRLELVEAVVGRLVVVEGEPALARFGHRAAYPQVLSGLDRVDVLAAKPLKRA
jgi:hypothetical protein